MNESRLQVSDLMVGDLMKVAKNVCVEKGAIVRILGMDSTITLPHKELIGCVLFVRSNDIDEIVHGVYIDAIEPIPLTPEILEKNGFRLIDDSYYYSDGDNVVLTKNYGNYPGEHKFDLVKHTKGINKRGQYANIDYYIATIDYVHQLQHALHLCGIEKEIIL